MFEPRLALASLSGESDAEWALNAETWAGAAFLGGIALDDLTREAAHQLVARDRTEFLPPDPVAFIDRQLTQLEGTDLQAGFNIRTSTVPPLRAAARTCANHGAILEINAHCRQDEMCAAGSGEALLRDTTRLRQYVSAAANEGATVSVKVRAEVNGVSLPSLGTVLQSAGADCFHVDAMDSETVIRDVREACDLFLIANNGVRDRATVREYLSYGADAVSVGRPSDNPHVLRRVFHALEEVPA